MHVAQDNLVNFDILEEAEEDTEATVEDLIQKYLYLQEHAV